MAKRMSAQGGYDFGNQELLNIANAIASSSAVTLAQLNAAVAAALSNMDFKGSVRVASTSNVSVSSAPATVDGVGLTAGDRILLKNQTTASENGIYTFASTGAALTRASDASSSAMVSPGLWTVVEEGTVNADSAWYLTTNNPLTLGTTGLSFSRYPPTSFGMTVKVAVTGPPSAGTTWVITHNLGTDDVVVSVRDISTKAEADFDVVHTDTSTATVGSSSSMAQNGYRATIVG